MYRNILLLILFQYLFDTGVSMEIRSNLYTKFAGNDIKGGKILNGYTGIERMTCAVRCTQLAECRSFTYTQSKDCLLYDKRIHDFGTFLAEFQNYDHYSEIQDKVTDEEWELVFRGESGNGMKISDGWLSNVADDPRTINPNCFSILKEIQNCGKHFKTKKMFMWQFLTIKKVKLNFYKGLNKVVEMIFNGDGSTKDNWFRQNRLNTSNWSDIKTADTAYFSIDGQVNRHFYTTTQNNMFECGSNLGWTVVIDYESNACSFDKRYEVPAFLYSSSDNRSNFDTDALEADVMAVFVSSV